MINHALFSSEKKDWCTPQQFFDEGNAYPAQLAELVEDLKKLDAASLEHISAIVKEMLRRD